MIRAAICDDDIQIRNQIEGFLQEISDSLEIELEVVQFADGSDIVNAVNAEHFFHIIFMDIEMERLNGLNAAKEIRKKDWYVQIIYISNYKDYVFQSFETRPFYYLLKPLDREQFCRVFMKAYYEILGYQGDFIFKIGKKQIRLKIKEILYFASYNKSVIAYFSNHKEVFSARLKQVECQLENSAYPFIRIHKSYLVSYFHIRSKTPDVVELNDGTMLTISRNMKELVGIHYAELVIRMKGH